jgi:TonB-linked SusC/RagA family outer membrane protein
MNNLITKLLSKKLKFLFAVMCLISFSPAFAQQEKVSGVVKSAKDNEPLIGVNVSEKGTKNATLSDANGKFSIQVANSNATLTFSYLGYVFKEVSLQGKANITVSMTEDTKSLNEVVVIGYGSVRKSDLTGSVSSIKADELTKGANINLQQGLQGRVPGVQIYQKSGEPGAAMSVQIRGITSLNGNNEPLYVIDGLPINNASGIGGATPGGVTANPNGRSPLSNINPADIESIEILKDASSTAIYGSRGANGVVLITTKRGKIGKMKVTYDATFGQQQVSNTMRYMTGDEYTSAINGIIDDYSLDPSLRVTGINYNTDWQSLLLKDAQIQSHDISFSGGSESTKFFISAGYFNQDGIMLNSGTKRYNSRINLENGIANKYNIGVNITTSYARDDYNSTGMGINDNGSALYMAQNYDPTTAAFNADGTYARSPFMSPMDNPLAVINGQYGMGDTYRTLGSIYGEYFIIPSLSAKAKIGGEINDTQRYYWIDPSTLNGAKGGLYDGGYADVRDGKRGHYLFEGTLNYNKTLGVHRISAVAGATYERYTSSSLIANGQGYDLPDLTYNAIGNGAVTTKNGIGSGRQEYLMLSYLGRVNYSLMDKYLFTASFRSDASSRFGTNKRVGYFPSAAFAWKISEEDFLKNNKVIDNMKLRMSYGATGNQPNINYLYFSTYSSGRLAVFNDTYYNSLEPTRSPNYYLQWESANQADFGLDFGLFKSKLNGSVDYYNRKTDRLLYNVPTPLSSGFGSQTQNIGSMRNTGLEFMLNGVILDKTDLKINASANFSTVTNKILSLGDQKEKIDAGPASIGELSILRPGESFGSIYGYIVDGVWQTGDDFSTTDAGVRPGDFKYRDIDDSKTITTADRVIIGNSLPDFYYGFNTNISYKAIGLEVAFEGSHGAKMLNNSLVDTYYYGDFRRNKLADVFLNRWTPTNPTNDYPSFAPGTAQTLQKVNTKTVEDASYLRLQSVRLSYKLPVSKLKVFSNATVFVNGQNLYTFTKYSGVDPAINSNGSDIVRVDYSSYPMTRTITGGINIQF